MCLSNLLRCVGTINLIPLSYNGSGETVCIRSVSRLEGSTGLVYSVFVTTVLVHFSKHTFDELLIVIPSLSNTSVIPMSRFTLTVEESQTKHRLSL